MCRPVAPSGASSFLCGTTHTGPPLHDNLIEKPLGIDTISERKELDLQRVEAATFVSGTNVFSIRGIETFPTAKSPTSGDQVGRGPSALEGLKHSAETFTHSEPKNVGRGPSALEGLKLLLRRQLGS